MDVLVRRLSASDADLAEAVCRVMATTFGEGEGLPAARLAHLLRDERFWLFAALVDGSVVGGVTAHVLPMTREEGHELFLYDIAVLPSHQRLGIGTRLMQAVIEAGRDRGYLSLFVPAESDDHHALKFYRAIGGEAQGVTFFNFDLRTVV